jgi:hypothetical protein
VADQPDKPGGEVLSSLPSTRPQRPSARREATKGAGAKAKSGGRKATAGAKSGAGRKTGAGKAAPKAARAKSGAGAAKPRGAATSGGRRPQAVRPSAATDAAGNQTGDRPPQTPQGAELVGTAVQAAGELAQLGLELGTRALAGIVKRIPRP